MLIDEIQGREDEDDDGNDAGQSRNPPFSGFLHGQDFEYLASAGAPAGAPTVTAAGAFGTDTVTTAGSGLVFVNTYGAGVSTAFHTAIVQAETYLESHFTNSITIHASFDLQQLSSSFSGQNSFGGVGATYQQIVNALNAHATSADDHAAVNKLQSMTDPSGGQLYFVPNAQAKMLGLPGTTNGTDDTIILNSLYWNDSSISAHMGDAVGVLLHELTEGGMGRIGGQWAMMDLFRYTAQGQLDDTGGQDGKPTYFSPNGQNINTGLQFHSPVNAAGHDDGFDWADWDQVGTNSNAHDPFGPGGPGAGDPGTLSATDLQIMDVLGWNKAGVGASTLTVKNDFTGDGVADVLWRDSSSGTVEAWVMNGGNVGSTNVLGMVSTAWQLAGTGDINGNHVADLIWRNTSTGAVESWLINNGQMVGGTGLGIASSAWQAVGVGDFTGDGTADLLWRNSNTGAVESWVVNNGQVTGGSGVGMVSSVWKSLGVGDFNGDGTADIVWQNSSTGEVDTWLMQGGHINGGTAIGVQSTAWKFLGIGDFDANGAADLLWQNNTTGEVDTWLMQNGTVSTVGVLGTMSSGWQVGSIGDFYGTGTADILWHNPTSGASTVWQVANDQVTGTHSVPTMTTNWQTQTT
jgi:hypothetical protein